MDEIEGIAPLYEEVIGEFKKLARKGKPQIIAIDGRCGSGKTTFASLIKQVFDCNVFHMDDFFLPPEMKTVERLSEPGGNVHYERVLEEIIQPISKGEGIQLIPFNCAVNDLEKAQTIPFKKLNFIEGAYALHPVLESYYDYKVFMTVEPKTQLERIAKRSPAKLDRFIHEWIPLEESYLHALQVEKKADQVVDTSNK